jgi:hypothetical protein
MDRNSHWSFILIVPSDRKDFILFPRIIPYVKASAVAGITGLKKIIYDAVLMFSKRNISTFDSIDSAKEWLAQN